MFCVDFIALDAVQEWIWNRLPFGSFLKWPKLLVNKAIKKWVIKMVPNVIEITVPLCVSIHESLLEKNVSTNFLNLNYSS